MSQKCPGNLLLALRNFAPTEFPHCRRADGGELDKEGALKKGNCNMHSLSSPTLER